MKFLKLNHGKKTLNMNKNRTLLQATFEKWKNKPKQGNKFQQLCLVRLGQLGQVRLVRLGWLGQVSQVRSVRLGQLGQVSQDRLVSLGQLGYISQVSLVSVCAKFQLPSMSRSG